MEFVMSLKDLVQDIHTKAENEAFAKLLMSGDINPTQYATYLFNQEVAYRAVEAQADKHGILDDIPEIRRAEKIKEDFKTVRFMRVIRPGGAKMPDGDHVRVLPSVSHYCNYVNEGLTEDQCWAHIYVRHFGDMYGGNMISKRIKFMEHQMYNFERKKELLAHVRSKLSDDMRDEAILVFGYAIKLFKDLKNEFNL